MFLLNYFYGKDQPQQPCEQGIKPEEDWVLVDNNEPNGLSTSIEDYGVLETNDLLTSITTTDQQPAETAAITPIALEQPQEDEPLVQNPPGPLPRAQRPQRVNAPVRHRPSMVALTPQAVIRETTVITAAITTSSNKVKNICKKQAQRRADKYKSGVWSGRSNDRKCGKCY